MSKLHRYVVIVKGSGQFPLDMLRYDHCWPRTLSDSAKMDKDWGGELRTIELLADKPRAWVPTVGRWHSFTWDVVSHTVLS